MNTFLPALGGFLGTFATDAGAAAGGDTGQQEDPLLKALEDIDNRFGEQLDLTDKQIQIAQLTGDYAKEQALQEQKRNLLQQKQAALENLLAKATPGSDDWYKIAGELADTQIALLQLGDSIGSGLQSFSSAAWQWFRKAIFNAVGGLLPGFAPDTGGGPAGTPGGGSGGTGSGPPGSGGGGDLPGGPGLPPPYHPGPWPYAVDPEMLKGTQLYNQYFGDNPTAPNSVDYVKRTPIPKFNLYGFPQFANGGIMPWTGMAHLEQGETVLPPEFRHLFTRRNISALYKLAQGMASFDVGAHGTFGTHHVAIAPSRVDISPTGGIQQTPVSTGGDEYHVHVTNPTEVVDPDYLSKRFAWNLKTNAKGGLNIPL